MSRLSFKNRVGVVDGADHFCPHSKGEKVTAPAHGATIDIQGITIAHVNEKVQLQSVETWFDPMEMFRQIAPNGIVNKTIVDPMPSQDLSAELHDESHEHSTEEKTAAEKHHEAAHGNAVVDPADSFEARAALDSECPFLMNKD